MPDQAFDSLAKLNKHNNLPENRIKFIGIAGLSLCPARYLSDRHIYTSGKTEMPMRQLEAAKIMKSSGYRRASMPLKCRWHIEAAA